MFKKTITILISFFVVAMVLLNFGFITSEAKYLSGKILKSDKAESKELLPISDSRVYKLPISEEKKYALAASQFTPKPTIKKTPAPTVIPAKPHIPVISLEIPALGVKAPVIIESKTTQSVIYKQLEKGVVHYGTSPLPGDYGTALILGHSSSPNFYKGNYATVFAGLSKLNIGDSIKITRDGQLLEYKVTKTLTFSPKTVSDYELGEFEFTNSKTIILMSCWPVGTNYKRVAVRADLI